MELDIAIRIAGLFAIIGVFVFAIFFIISFRAVTRLVEEVAESLKKLTVDVSVTLNDMSRDINELKLKVTESLEIIDGTSQQIASSFETLENQASTVYKSIQPFTVLFKLVYDRIAPPLNTSSLIVSAASKAVESFLGIVFKKK